MISFKLSPQTHAAVSRVIKVLTWIGFLAGVALVAYTGFNNYRFASAVMSNHKVVDAALTFDGTTIAHKKRRDVTTYHFSYQFVVNGAQYTKSFSTSESNADAYMDKTSVQVAYKADNPSMNGRLAKLEGDADLVSWLKRLAMGIPLFGLVAFVVYIILTRRLFVVRAEAA